MNIRTLQIGGIVAFKTKAIWYNPLTWLGPIIRKIAKIEYNHVGIICKINGELFLAEAINKGFMPTNLEEKLKTDKHIKDWCVLRPVYEFDKFKLNKECISLLGNKYDYKGLLWNQLILNLFGIWIGRKNNQQDKLYCYEAVFYLHRQVFPKWWMMRPEKLFNNKNFEKLS